MAENAKRHSSFGKLRASRYAKLGRVGTEGMNVETWQLAESAPGGKASALSDAISRTFGYCECGFIGGEAEVAASFTKIPLGQLTLVRFFGEGIHWADRRIEHVRRLNADDFLFYLPHDSVVTITQRGTTSRFAAGKVGFVNTRDAYRGKLESAGRGSFESTHIIVPGSVLRSRFPGIDDLAGQAIEIGQSLHGVFSAYVSAIDNADCELASPQHLALSNILFETICSVSEYALRSRSTGSTRIPPTQRALERIQTFALTNLTNPGLSVTMIAERLNMSPRYVHSAFEDTKWTAKSWIKHRRLLECRKAIRSPSMTGRTLTEIAYSWGFSDFSHFSRCYKAKFGCSPKHDRAVAE